MQNPYYFYKDCFGPVTLLVPSVEVEEALKKNGEGFTISTLFNLYTNIVPTAPIRLRIVDPSNGKQQADTSVTLSVVQLRWQTLAGIQNAQRFQYLLIQPNKDLPTVTSTAQCTKFQVDFVAKALTPWFDEYRFKYYRSLGPSGHEMFEHPIACILATTSADKNPVETFRRLFDTKTPPERFPKYMDASVMLFTYVIVHDASSGVELSEAQKKLELIKKSFKATNCHLVTINSLSTPGPNPNMPTLPNTLLSKEDLETVQNMIRSFSIEALVPQLQTVLRGLYDEINKVRDSFTDWVKRAVGSKSSKIDDRDGARYPANSLEFRERRLADWAFLVGDWGVAHKTYKSLAGIYDNDKLFAYLGSANEMMAICLLMLRESQLINAKTPQTPGTPTSTQPVPPLQWSEIDDLFKRAWSNYLLGGKPAWARRSALSHGFWAQWRQQPAASYVFENLADQPNIEAVERALLLQQASLSYLLRPVPRLRKYSYQMAQAADSFSQSNQLLHALTAYKAAYGVYAERQWLPIEDYLHFRIARLSFALNKHDQAMKFVNLLLSNNDESPDLQNSYLREFLYIYTTAKPETTSANPPTLPLPLLSKTVVVHLNDFVSQMSDPEWTLMEEVMMELLQPPERRIMFTLKKPPTVKDKIAVVGETIYVELELKNPLKVPVQFTDVHVVCNLITPSSTPAAKKAPDVSTDGIIDSPAANGDRKQPDPQSDAASTEIEPPLVTDHYEILLAPLEAKRIQFAIRPTQVGVLHITGIAFKVCGIVGGLRELPKPHPVVKVTTPQPRLVPSLIDWPDHEGSLLIGQLHRCTLRLQNAGKMPLKNLALTTSHPHFLVCDLINDDTMLHNLLTTTNTTQPRGWVGRIRLDAPLPPGEHIDVPLWIRPTSKGIHTLKFMFYYEPTTPSPEMKHRLQRAVASLRAIVSMKVTAAVRPDPATIDRFILAVDAESLLIPGSKRILPTISLRQFQFWSHHWRVEFLSSFTESHDSHGHHIVSHELPGKHTCHMFFSIRRKAASSNTPVTAHFSEIEHNIEGVPYISLLNRERLADKLTITPKVKSATNFNFDNRTRDEIEEANHIALVNEQHKINAVLLWEIGTRAALCQINVPDISFIPDAPWLGTSDPKPPILFKLESETHVVHSFSQGFCCVKLRFRIFNSSPFTPVAIQFEGIKPNQAIDEATGAIVSPQDLVSAVPVVPAPLAQSVPSSPMTASVVATPLGSPIQPSSPAPAAMVASPISEPALIQNSEYLWAGTTRTQIAQLPCLSEDHIDVQLCFPQPGIFNINRYRFLVTPLTGPHKRKAPVIRTSQYFIVIVDKDAPKSQ